MSSAAGTDIRNAAIDGDIELVKKLLSEGADVGARMNTGNLNTPLHNAVSRGHEKVAKVLLEHGADIKATNKNGETALHLAIRHNFLSLVQFLMDNGADINDEPDNENNFPLHKAAICGNPRIVSLLLRSGANRQALNDDGKTAKQLATRSEVLKVFEEE